MRKKIVAILAICASVIVIGNTNVNASIVTTTWIGTINKIDTNDTLAYSIWDIGDTITFSATYDDAGGYLTTYSDGPNGLAELGGGDDSILYQLEVNPSCCNWWSDAEITIDPKTELYISQSSDGTSQNRAWVGERADNSEVMGQLNRDGVFVWNFTTNGGLYTYENDQYVGYPVSWTNYEATTTPSSAVPVPGAVWLLGSGLTGLMGLKSFRKRTKEGRG